MDADFKTRFLEKTEDTGRHIYTSFRTGKVYAIEVIDKSGRPADWGSYNPSTGNIENKKGSGKHIGSVTPEESMITEENGFVNIQTVESGSPYSLIEELDSKYPTLVR